MTDQSTKEKGEQVKTQAQFKKAAVAAFKKANPDADTAIKWGWCSKKVKWADGSYGWTGWFVAVADGFKPKRVNVSGDESTYDYFKGGTLFFKPSNS